MSRLEDVIAYGNRGHWYRGNNNVTCADGFTLSVIAGGGAYCSPRPTLCWPGRAHAPETEPGSLPCDYPGPYLTVEVGFPSKRPEPWDEWKLYGDGVDEDPTQAVYARVPIELVRALVAAHGGEVS